MYSVRRSASKMALLCWVGR